MRCTEPRCLISSTPNLIRHLDADDRHDRFQQIQFLVLQRSAVLVMVLLKRRQLTRTVAVTATLAVTTATVCVRRVIRDVPVFLQAGHRVQQEMREILAQPEPP